MLFYQNLLRMVVSINFHLFASSPSIACSFSYYFIQEPGQAKTENCRFLFAGFYCMVFSREGKEGIDQLSRAQKLIRKQNERRSLLMLLNEGR